LAEGETRPIVVLDAGDSQVVDLDCAQRVRNCGARGSRYAPADSEPGAVARPRDPDRDDPLLGVVSREISLLPRHWNGSGRNAAARRQPCDDLVDEARVTAARADRLVPLRKRWTATCA